MDIYISLLAIIFGLIIGSFLNCLIWRLYQAESLGGRSYCPQCRGPIAWYDNIPLLSFFLLVGRCRRCHRPISWQYPLVELATAILFWLVFRLHVGVFYGPGLEGMAPLIRDLVIAVFLIVIFVYDFRWQLVPLSFVWLMSVFVLVLNLIIGIPWPIELLYGAIGGAFFLIQFILTKKQGVGEGDIWLGVWLGLAFPGWGWLLLIMVMSYGIGSLTGLALLASGRKKWKSAIALGPFLASGALIALIFGEKIINWYFGLLY